jgi:hypothetical protein
MSSALSIRFKSSQLGFVSRIISFALACYWISIVNIFWIFKIPLGLTLITIVGFTYRQYQSQKLIGIYHLTDQGIFCAEEKLRGELLHIRLLQRLPWCLQLHISNKNRNYKYLIWRDALDRGDWCKLRRYLSELNPDQGL